MDESRISGIDAYLMTVVAIIIDLIQLVPIVGSLMDILASILFGVWFAHYDVHVISKRPGGFWGTVIAEFIPIFDWVPFWTYFVITTIRAERAEAAE